MASGTIKGGYYFKAKKIQESWIAHQPPHVREIWDYLLREANFTDKKYSGFLIKRGQLFRTYKQIREALHWKVGYRKMRYSETQIKKGMHALRCSTKIIRRVLSKEPEHEPMIDTTKELGGVLITIRNYDFYQTISNYERTSERTDEKTTKEPMKEPSCTHTKKEKEIKDIYVQFRQQKFDEFFSMYRKKEGRKDALKAWTQLFSKNNKGNSLGELTDNKFKQVMSALSQQNEHKYDKSDKQYIPLAGSWLRGHRWDDEIEIKEDWRKN